jgi:hypothetical protein
MRTELQMLLAPYKAAAPRRPSSSTSSRRSTCGGGLGKLSHGTSKPPHAVAQGPRRVYAGALHHHAAPSSGSLSHRRPKLPGPQTLKDLGQQIIRDHHKRLATAGPVPRRFPHCGISSEKQVLSLTAAGGEVTHLHQLLARYKVLSKELASTKVSALQQEAGCRNPSRTRLLNSSKSLDVQERMLSSSRSDTIPSSASWPAASPLGHSAASSPEPRASSFGLSSVISMSKSHAFEIAGATCQVEASTAHNFSSSPQQQLKRGFGLSALLMGRSSLAKQIGGMVKSQFNESAVT